MPSLRHSWRSALPEPLPATPHSHFQAPVGVRQLLAQRDGPQVLVTEDDSGVVATWVLHTTGSDLFDRPESRLARVLDRRLLALHGPTIRSDASGSVELRTSLLRAVRARVRRLQPTGTELRLYPILSEEERSLWARAAAAAGYEASEAQTWFYEVGSDASDEDVAARIKSERRKTARKGERAGLVFEERSDLDGLRAYNEVRTETRRHNDQSPIPFEHWERTWHAFEGSGVFHVFLASLEGRVGAAQLAFAWEGYVYLVGVSVAEWTREEKVPANDFLQYRLLTWAAESGQRIVDFVGASPDATDPKLKAIDYFKSRWGTELGTSLTLTLAPVRGRARLAHYGRRFLG
jgi:hypothetical protein